MFDNTVLHLLKKGWRRDVAPVRRAASGLAATAIALCLAISSAPNANAQEVLDSLGGPTMVDNERLLLDADTLTFDQNRNVVTVSGDVQIFFAGNSLEADRVVYDRGQGTLRAVGRVRLVEATGNVLRTEEIQLSDDFREGFANSLQVDGLDDTFFAATRGERIEGNVLVLERGVYSVCGVCRSRPGRIPTWRIKAEEIVINEKTHRISYKNASLELLGVPVAYVPRFSHTDPRIKQKTGLLGPKFIIDNDLGNGGGVPFYYAFDESTDVTVTPIYLSKQGLLGDIEWRRRVRNGAYTFHLVGIDQQSPEEFEGTSGDRGFRGGIRTTGDFALNQNWSAGWDILAITDRTFPEDYELLTERVDRFTSNVNVTGLSTSRYFDASGLFFNILDDDDATSGDLQGQQAIVHPVIDYDGIIDQAIGGGQLSFTTNITSLSRAEDELSVVNGETFLDGASGTQGRGSAELEWKRQLIVKGGHVITPSLAVRGDVQGFSRDSSAFTDIPDEDVLARGQVTAGLEWRYPVLIRSGNSSHIIEPIAQFFVSPNETQIDSFLNEDSQTVLFDDTNIFQRDRFAGFDRVEGGTRANVGVTYQGQLTDWLTADALVGESFHLAGQNSFADQGVASVYAENGLESDRSDIVTRFGVTAIDRFSLTSRARFDESEVQVNRADFEARYRGENVQGAFGYTLVREQPLDDLERSSQIFGEFAVKPHEYWTLFGNGRYDLDDSRFVNNRIGFAFDDRQLRLSLAFRQDFDTNGERDGEGVEFRVNFRTLGGF